MLKSAMLLFFCSIISKILGFIRELVVAYKFGAGPITDAFVITNNIPVIFFSALATAIGINYVPVVVGIESPKEREKFTRNIINVCLLILIAGIALILLFPNFTLNLFAAGIKSDTREYAKIMLNITVFSAVPIVLSYVFQAYLQVKNSFFATGITSIIINIIVIAFTQVSSEKTFYLLSMGTVTANVVALLILWISSHRVGYRHGIEFTLKDRNLKLLITLTLPLLAETIISNVNTLVDKNMASFLDTGTMTGLSYAGNLSNMAYAMIATSIITVVFPRFAKFIAEEKIGELKREFLFFSNILILMLIPISLFLCFMAGPTVDILFKRGAFDAHAARITAQSLTYYAPGLFFAGMQTYVIRAFYAMKDTKTPTLYAIFALVTNIALNFLFIASLKHVGLALATTLARAISYIILLIKLKKKLGMTFSEIGVMSVIQVSMCGILSGSVTLYIFENVINYWNKYLSFMCAGILFMCMYVLGLIIIRFKPLKECISFLAKRRDDSK